jgi:P-type conjugative transfer protein TrbG
MRRVALVVILSAAALAQSPTRPSPDKYPFGAIGAELAKDPASMRPVIHGDPRLDLQAKAAKALADAPPVEEPIPVAAKNALAVAEIWKTDAQMPAAGKDGRVLYTFGAGMATMVCAPLRVCVLELQSGEQVVGEPHIGDSVRWSIAPAISGAGNSATNLVVIKPKEAGLDTNLVVPTNRRSYYVRLVSRTQDYIPLVAFTYPDDDMAQWRKAVAAQQRSQEEAETSQLTPVDSISGLNFDYQVSGGTEFLRPVRVLDDGKKTYIQMPEGTAVREAPILVVAGLDHNAEMVNYRVKGSMYIVDRLFDRGALLLGSGKKQERVDIVRSGKGAKEGGKVSLLKKKDPIEEAYLQLKRTPVEGAPDGVAKAPEPGDKPAEK